MITKAIALLCAAIVAFFFGVVSFLTFLGVKGKAWHGACAACCIAVTVILLTVGCVLLDNALRG